MSFQKSMIAMLFIALIIVVGCSSNKTGSGKAAEGVNPSTSVQTTKMEKDVVCGMGVIPDAQGTLKTEYEGRAYYFCSETCKKSFEANPGKYIHNEGASDSHEMPMPK
jgi:YHS domain-containing protein